VNGRAKHIIRNPGLWPCHFNDCNSKKISVLLWNRKAWLNIQAFNPPAADKYGKRQVIEFATTERYSYEDTTG
jgi:hypothetical protein